MQKKTYKNLKWINKLNFKQSVLLTANWYNIYFKSKNMKNFTFSQIQNYKKNLK